MTLTSLTTRRAVSVRRSGDTKFRWELGPEQGSPVLVDDLQQLGGVRVVHDELHQDSHIAGQFEEMLFVHDTVPPEASNGFKDRSAMDMCRFGFLEEPFVQQDPPVLLILVHVETKRITLHNERLQ